MDRDQIIVRTEPFDKGSFERMHILPIDQDREPWSEPFYFVQAADTQFGLIERLKNSPKPNWFQEIAVTKTLVELCNRLEPKPKFLVVCGDFVDAPPGTQLRRQQLTDLKRCFSRLDTDIPLVCVCGNHDIGDQPTSAGLQEYWHDFGDDYYYFVTGGVLFIVINSQFYEHRANLEEYAKQQDDWLENILAKCKDYKYSIVFQHIPWYLQTPDEEKEYFNLEKGLRDIWLKKFSDAGVDKIMCGHYHRNAGGWYDSKMELVVTSAVGAQLGDRDKNGARLVKLCRDKIEHEYFAFDSFPTEVDLS